MWKKVLKITLWTLLSLFLLFSGGMAVGVYWVFTPERITPTLRAQLQSMLLCKTDIGSVKLKLFSGYRVLSLEINDVLLRHSIEEAAGDTLLAAKQAYLEVDWMQWWKHGQLDIREVRLVGPKLYYFVNGQGKNNWDIFPKTSAADTSQTAWPFQEALLPKFEMIRAELRYRDVPGKMEACIHGLDVSLSADYKKMLVAGTMRAASPRMRVRLNDEPVWQDYPLQIDAKFAYRTDLYQLELEQLQLVSDELAMHFLGTAQGEAAMEHWNLQLKGSLEIPEIKKLIDRVPESMKLALAGMQISGNARVEGTVKGMFGPQQMPEIDFFLDVPELAVTVPEFKDIPVFISGMKMRLHGDLDYLDRLKVDLRSVQARLLDAEFSGEGTVDRLMDQIHFVGQVNGRMNMAAISAHFLDTMGYPVQGRIRFDAKMDVSMEAFLKQDWKRLHVDARADYTDFSAASLRDTMGFQSVAGHLELLLHPEEYAGKSWFMHLKGYTKEARIERSGKELARYAHLNLDTRTSNFMDTTAGIEAAIEASLADLEVPEHALQPAAPPQVLRIPLCSLNLLWTPEQSELHEARLQMLGSDLLLRGQLKHFTSYLMGKEKLWGRLQVSSQQLDLGALMALGSAWGIVQGVDVGVEKGVEKRMVEENSAKSPSVGKDTAAVGGGPLMIPADVDLEMKVQVNQALYGLSQWKNLQGALTVKDGRLLLDKFKLSMPAGQVQLTALYRTPRKNHLFAGFDFHMVEVEVDELIRMIPDVDSIMPMLRSFSGKAEFHMVGETYTDSLYNIKRSTLRGAASIAGQNLVLKDGHAFTEIARTLKFSKKNRILVDSLSAELTLFKNEVDVYPFQISMENYKAVISGRHNLDMSFNYHISVTDSPLPFRLGVNVYGTMNDLNFRLAPVRYGYRYRPTQQRVVETEVLNLRKMIRSSLAEGSNP